MNNTDFRNFVASTPRRPDNETPRTTARPNATPSTLGSRARSSIPMTPRSVLHNTQSDFARQLAQQRAASQPTRKFRSTAAPKGTRLAEGYHDRARAREEQGAEDDREARLQALEEQMKLGQIDLATFEQLRDTITGGELESTHLVKGLDRKLLERVRRGENVQGNGESKVDSGAKEETEKALEEFEEKEVAPAAKQEVVKKGEMAPPPPPQPVAGVKRSRNDILAEMRASRKAAEDAKAAAQNTLGDRFRKIGGKETNKYPRIEKDDQGREVLITKDENGRIKRKVRKIEVKETPLDGRARDDRGLLVPENLAKPLGMEEIVPVIPTAPEADDDEDIFAGVGTEYDPLKAEMDAATALSSSDEDGDESQIRPLPVSSTEQRSNSPIHNDTSGTPSRNRTRTSTSSQSPGSTPERQQESETILGDAATADPEPTSTSSKRNYFGTKPGGNTSAPPTDSTDAPFKDPTILAALKRASAIASRTNEAETPNEATDKPSTAAQRLLSGRDRDYEDMDMGFGGSRGGDEDDAAEEGGSRVKLSQWRGLPKDQDDEEEGDEKGGKKGKGARGERKRGGKKRKGDKESAVDVLKVIESRKKT